MPGKSTSSDKLLGLEALRFVAAFSVLIWHYQHFSDVADRPVNLIREQLPFYGLFRPFYNIGEYGVWVFWCISGFIFFWNYRDAIANASVRGWTFFIYRLSRLYPLHLVTLIIVAILQAAYFHLQGYFFVYQNNDLQHFIPQVFLASDWGFQRSNSFNAPIWSISVEVVVYSVFFLLLRFVSKSPLLNLTIIAVSLNVSGQVFSCLAFFYAGGLAAITRRTLQDTNSIALIEGMAWSTAAAIPGLIWIFGLQSSIVDWVFVLTYTPLLLFCLSRKFNLSTRVQTILAATGNMTYSSYLLHFPIQLLIALGFTISGNPIPFYESWFFIAFMTSTLLASYATYRYFEAPAQTFLRNHLILSPGRKTSSNASVRQSHG